ncbi:FUSC family protein [Streptomyces sp. NPDC059009]|uniref:FUSC family protein n=1 Tax=Streptomyces sp. NPDC059009 TaxID=3346694 RepID=UPI0036B4D126
MSRLCPGSHLSSPPGWLARTLDPLKPRPARTPWPAVVRAGVSMALPLAVGIASGYPAYGALVSMGGLSSVISGDSPTSTYRMRVFNIGVPQLFSSVGIALGTLVYGHGWVAVAVVTAIALMSGMISTIGAVSSASGMLLLMNAVVGAGLPMPEPWWAGAVLMGAGGLLVLLLSLLAWPLRSGLPERAAVADTYRAVADLLEAAALGPSAYAAARQNVTQLLNQSYDLLLSHRARDHGRRPDLVRLVGRLNALIPVVEAAPAIHQCTERSGRPLPVAVPTAVRTLADAVDRGFTGPVALRLPEPEDPATRALDDALRHAAEAIDGTDPDSDPDNADDRLGRPGALHERARRAARTMLLSGVAWRYGLRLALCIGLAQTLTSLIEVERSYWVALAVVFVMKPDFGSVFSRAVLRAVGIAAGLLLAAVVLSQVPRGWWEVAAMALLAPLIPALALRGYGYQNAAVTPVILLLSDVINHQGTHLIAPRLYDTVIGCGIALTAGYLLWPESWRTRIGDRLADTVGDTARYVECAFLDPEAPGVPDRAARARMRRRLYLDLAAVRTEFQRALTEPPPMGTRAAAWWPLVVAIERVVDATTAARIRMRHGAPWPPPADAKELALELEELADAVRGTTTLASTPEAPGQDEAEDGVLEPLRREVRAARAVASPDTGHPA